MSTLLTRVSYSLRVPSCLSRCTVVYGKQLTTWSDRLKRWHSSPKSEKDTTAKESSTETDSANSDNGVDGNQLSQLSDERDEMIAKQKAELEELNV